MDAHVYCMCSLPRKLENLRNLSRANAIGQDYLRKSVLDFTERGHQVPKYSHIEIALEENMPFTTWVGRGYFDEEDTLVCLVS
jgi:hypothetical protein